MTTNLQTYFGVAVGAIVTVGVAHLLNLFYAWEALALVGGFLFGLEAGFFTGNFRYSAHIHYVVLKNIILLPLELIGDLSKIRWTKVIRILALVLFASSIAAVVAAYLYTIIKTDLAQQFWQIIYPKTWLGICITGIFLGFILVSGLAYDIKYFRFMIVGNPNFKEWWTLFETGQIGRALSRFALTLLIFLPLYFVALLVSFVVGIVVMIIICAGIIMAISYAVLYAITRLCLIRQTMAIAMGTIIGGVSGLLLGWSNGRFSLILFAVSVGALAGCFSVYLLSLIGRSQLFTRSARILMDNLR